MEERNKKLVKDFYEYKYISDIAKEIGISRERARVLLNRQIGHKEVRRIKSRRSAYVNYMGKLLQNCRTYKEDNV